MHALTYDPNAEHELHQRTIKPFYSDDRAAYPFTDMQ